MISKKKIGIYGGTFNPPHIAHVRACNAFYNFIKPDELLVIPDFLPPHKEVAGGATAEDRLEMTKLAFSSMPYVTVSEMEIQRGGRSYTALTLSELKREDNELYFLCGTDMFLTLDSWYRPDIIFELANICYVRREEDRANDIKISQITDFYKEKYNANIIPISADVTELSSSEVREKIRSKEDITEIIPENVKKYIQNKGIYK